jgi:hypothetical protein
MLLQAVSAQLAGATFLLWAFTVFVLPGGEYLYRSGRHGLHISDVLRVLSQAGTASRMAEGHA